MTSDELRDRIAEIVNAALVAWNTDMDTQDSEGEYAAQAITDEFGLTVEERIDQPGKRGINPVSRIVGKWEAEE